MNNNTTNKILLFVEKFITFCFWHLGRIDWAQQQLWSIH